MLCLKLFLCFLQIGCFSFGGGYAAVPLIQEQLVIKNQWITMNTFVDLVTIAEMTPGPIAVNAATFVGMQIAGFPGVLAATFGCILPSCIFVTALTAIYMKYRKVSMMQGVLGALRPAVVASIAKAGVTICQSAFYKTDSYYFHLDNISIHMIIYFGVALFLLRKKKMNPILVMVMCGIIEFLRVCMIN